MFPAPRQAAVDAMTIQTDIPRRYPTRRWWSTAGTAPRVIPLSNSLRLLELIDQAQLLRVFGRCDLGADRARERFNRLVTDFLG